MRRILVLVLGFLLTLAMATPAAAVQPDREPFGPVSFTYDSSFCGFPVAVTFPGTTGYVTTYFDQAGNIIKIVFTPGGGELLATLTNTTNGTSITLNVPGPAQFNFVRGTFNFEGTNFGPLPNLPGLWLGHGLFNSVTGQIYGNFVPVCPLLAGG